MNERGPKKIMNAKEVIDTKKNILFLIEKIVVGSGLLLLVGIVAYIFLFILMLTL